MKHIMLTGTRKKLCYSKQMKSIGLGQSYFRESMPRKIIHSLKQNVFLFSTLRIPLN